MLSHNSKIAGEAAQGSDHSNSIISGTELAPTIWESPTHSSVTAGSQSHSETSGRGLGVYATEDIEYAQELLIVNWEYHIKVEEEPQVEAPHLE